MSSYSNVCYLKDYDMTQKPHRCGIILYTTYEQRLYFGLGYDSGSHDLTDFGGRRYKYETAIQCAIREFQEETLGIFKEPSVDELLECLVVYNTYNFILFMRVSLEPDIISRRFLECYESKKTNGETDMEVCGVTWLDEEQLYEALYKKAVLFKRVRRFLAGATRFVNML